MLNGKGVNDMLLPCPSICYLIRIIIHVRVFLFSFSKLEIDERELKNNVFSVLFRFVDTFSTSLLCNRIPGLSPPQRQMCIESPDAVSSLALGQVIAATECEHQFKGKK